MHDDPLLVRRAIGAGASGSALKGISQQQLIATVRAVCDGEAVLQTVWRSFECPIERRRPLRPFALAFSTRRRG